MNYDTIKKLFDEWGSLISIFLSPLFAWLFTRDKQKIENKKLSAEKDSVVVQSTEKLVKQWEEFYTQIREDYREVQLINDNYAKQVNFLLTKVGEFEQKLNSVEIYTKNLQEYTEKIESYAFEIKEAVEILILEIEKDNPDFALDKRLKIKEALRKLENAKKP